MAQGESWAGCQMLGPACPHSRRPPCPPPPSPWPGPPGPVCTEVLAWLPHSGAPGGLGHREGSEDRRVPPCSLPMLPSAKAARLRTAAPSGSPHPTPKTPGAPAGEGACDGLGCQGHCSGPRSVWPTKAFLRPVGSGAWAGELGQNDSPGGALVCRGPGTTWGPAGGPGGRTFPGLVGVLERGVQLLEALLQRVALVVLHQLLQDMPTDCCRLQAGLLGVPAALCHLLRFTQGTPLLDPREPPSSSSPSTRPRAVAGIPKAFEPVISLTNVSKGKAREMLRLGAGVLLQPFIRRKAGTRVPTPGKCF